MLYLLTNIEIQNKLQTIYTYVTVVLDELFAEAPAAISLLMRSTVSSVQGGFSHLNTVPFSSKLRTRFLRKRLSKILQSNQPHKG